jgi:hypothetical protein
MSKRTVVITVVALGLPAGVARADLHCGESFEGSAMTQEDRSGNWIQLGSCGAWSNPTSEWSTDATTFLGNKALRRNDANVPGIWSDSHTAQTYGAQSDPNITMTADVIIDSWNSTSSDQRAAVYARVNTSTGNWYGVTIGFDGWLHLEKRNGASVFTFSFVDPFLGRDIAAAFINAQKGVWYQIRIETHNIYSGSTLVGVALTAYVDGVLMARFTDDGSLAGPLIENGAPGVGNKGCHSLWDNVIIGNGNDDGAFGDAPRQEESGESS